MEYRFVEVGGWQFVFRRYPHWKLVEAVDKDQWANRERALAEALLVLLGHNKG